MTAGKAFAITFVLFAIITLLVPSFPPAQLLYEYAKIPQTTSTLWGIFSIATLLNGFINGFFWVLVAAVVYAIAQKAGEINPLPPMPTAPHLAEPPPENPLIDDRVNTIPPALTITHKPRLTLKSEPAEAMITPELMKTETLRRYFEADIEDVDIETIEGIGPVCGGLLRNSGVKTVGDLLRVGATENGRRYLANEVGVTRATVLRWVCRGDLLRVRGIGGKYASLLESAGICTVEELSTKNPHRLRETLNAVNWERVRRIPSSKTIQVWVNNAKNLEPILVK